MLQKKYQRWISFHEYSQKYHISFCYYIHLYKYTKKRKTNSKTFLLTFNDALKMLNKYKKKYFTEFSMILKSYFAEKNQWDLVVCQKSYQFIAITLEFIAMRNLSHKQNGNRRVKRHVSYYVGRVDGSLLQILFLASHMRSMRLIFVFAHVFKMDSLVFVFIWLLFNTFYTFIIT